MILRVRLPYPDKTLNPNQYKGYHWSGISKVKKLARAIGYHEARIAVGSLYDHIDILFDKTKPLRLRVAIFPPDNRRRDYLNTMGALKSYEDGVFDALNLDDSMIKRTTITWHDKCKNGKIYYILYQK